MVTAVSADDSKLSVRCGSAYELSDVGWFGDGNNQSVAKYADQREQNHKVDAEELHDEEPK